MKVYLNRFVWAAFGLLLVLLATNRWLGWEGGIRYLSATDVLDGYWPVTLAAPGLPMAGSIQFHKAQRFFFPWLFGTVTKAFGGAPEFTYVVAMFSAQTALLAVLWWFLGKIGTPPRRRWIAFGLFAFQPYALRYYWIVPGMFSDVAFELGATLAIVGVVLRRPLLPWLGLALAALGRQTALLILPGLLFWIASGWRDRSYQFRIVLGAGLVALAFVFYEGTASIAARFGMRNGNAEVLTGLLVWIRSPDFSVRTLAEHVLRCTLPLLVPVALLLGELSPRLWPRETWLGLLIAGAVASQPFLAGPVITGQNAARLVSLGLPALTIAWAAASSEELSFRFAAFLGTLLFIGSFHHLYTLIGPAGPAGTAALQGIVVVGAFLLAFLQMRTSVTMRYWRG